MNFFVCELFRELYKLKFNQKERDELIKISDNAKNYTKHIYMHIALEEANKDKDKDVYQYIYNKNPELFNKYIEFTNEYIDWVYIQ